MEFKLHSEYCSPVTSLRRWNGWYRDFKAEKAADSAGRYRIRKDVYYGECHPAYGKADADHIPQQDAGGAAARGDEGILSENAVEYFVSYYDYYQPEAYVPSTDTYIEKDSDINQRSRS